MKFNPITRRLYTNQGIHIKTLHCPYSQRWDALRQVEGHKTRKCDLCAKDIVDTRGLADESVLTLVARDASACLKVDVSQDNIRVVNLE
jgi:hypothetical protein